MKALEILYSMIDGTRKNILSNKNTYERLTFIAESIEELEELENRSCDSCKHIRITQFRDYEKATCTNENCNEMFDCDVGSDFCCNKWENKQ